MRRREFITLLAGAAAAWPVTARAQKAASTRRVGVLMSTEEDTRGKARFAAFKNALADLGWVEGRNLSIVTRWGMGDEAYLRAHAAELVALQPDVILAAPTSSVLPAQHETKTIPIVIAQTTDPVMLGVVQSLAHPGGNVTGFANYDVALATKWVELLHQIAPSIVRVAVIKDPRLVNASSYLASVQAGARSLGIDVLPYEARDGKEIESAFAAFADQPNTGLIMPPSSTAVTYRDLVVSLADKYRIPAVYAYRYYAASGGLASYGVDDIDGYRRAASYVARIFNGEKPADLPVQYATKFELVINLKTAKALGLTIPESFLLLADEVIE
jgi:putative tryptophan/tyrosine transport system substrate-binding protein